MLLVMDIGNTNIKTAVYRNDNRLYSWRMTSDRMKTADEYGMLVEMVFAHNKCSLSEVNGIIVSSVVPSINFTIEHMCSIYFDQKPQFVNYRMKTGLTYRYDSPETLGTDRICNAVAAVHYYGSPCIVIDFGTATTFGAVSPENEFMGGIICPSLKIALNALVSNTSMLPNVEVEKPQFAVATNTAGAIQAGAIYGYVGQVEYLLRRMHKELGYKSRVIATGGLAHLIASETDLIDEVNQTLTLEGLNLIYGLNN